MRKNNILWAIIPARSGSKGLKDKNISSFLNKPLLTHSINFAKKLKFVDKIILSTDSKKYSEIGLKYGAEVPFLRSKNASESYSMEEDVLEDIRKNLLKKKITPPDYILWLRPTCPLRDVNIYKQAYKKFIKNKKSLCIVAQTDPRIFVSKNNKLVALNKNFKNKSMVRRQDCEPAYKIFYGEFFKFPKKYDKNFLGKQIHFIKQDDLCKIDIDSGNDLKIYEKFIKLNKKKYEKFLHTN